MFNGFIFQCILILGGFVPVNINCFILFECVPYYLCSVNNVNSCQILSKVTKFHSGRPTLYKIETGKNTI